MSYKILSSKILSYKISWSKYCHRTHFGKLGQPENLSQDSVVQLLGIPLPDFRNWEQILTIILGGLMTILNKLMLLCNCDDNFAWYLIFEMDLNGSWLMFQSLGFQQKGNGSQKGWNEIHQTNLEARQKYLEFGLDKIVNFCLQKLKSNFDLVMNNEQTLKWGVSNKLMTS